MHDGLNLNRAKYPRPQNRRKADAAHALVVVFVNVTAVSACLIGN
jgi:hypothetical protein